MNLATLWQWQWHQWHWHQWHCQWGMGSRNLQKEGVLSSPVGYALVNDSSALARNDKYLQILLL